MKITGTIKQLISEGEGYDDPNNGDWVHGTTVWSDHIPCLIVNNNGRLTKYQDGQNVSASFEILLEMRDFHESRIEVFQHGYSLGEFTALRPNIKFLTSVGRIKITV